MKRDRLATLTADPNRAALGSWVRTRREEVCLSQPEVSERAWKHFGVPLDPAVLSEIERGLRWPGVHCVDALLVLLGLTSEQQEELVTLFARNPNHEGDFDASTWKRFVRSEERPIPMSRRVGSKRLRRGKGGSVGDLDAGEGEGEGVPVQQTLKLRMTKEDDALLRVQAAAAGLSVSDVVRIVVEDALERRQTEYEVPSEDLPRTVDRNVRITLSTDQLVTQRTIGHGHSFAFWAYLILFDAIKTGKAAKLASELGRAANE
jgi:hypothetical protein